ncbi:MAG TPA: oligosaccharide flippase family protein, partial [Gammaproteobacteria bacterium]|nr:oligosaccharide flippase family protein [Gammaproteobacteria bacterium]
MTKAERFNRLIRIDEADGGLRARSVRGGLFNAVAEGADFILRVGSIAILARLLVPEHFGLIGMVTAITAIAERFKDLGLSVVTVQREEISHEQVSALFWVNAALGLAAGLIVAALAVPIASFYADERLVYITLAIALTFVWGGLAIQHQAILRRSMKFGQIATINISASLGSIVIAIVLAANGFGYWALVAREVARSVLVAIGTWACCRWVPSLPTRRTGARAMVSFGGSVTAVQLATHFSM